MDTVIRFDAYDLKSFCVLEESPWCEVKNISPIGADNVGSSSGCYKIPVPEVVSVLEASDLEFLVEKGHGYNHGIHDGFPIKLVL